MIFHYFYNEKLDKDLKLDFKITKTIMYRLKKRMNKIELYFKKNFIYFRGQKSFKKLYNLSLISVKVSYLSYYTL